MYDIRHRLIWAIAGFISAVSLLVLVSLAGYGLVQAILLSLLILALVVLILWILWVSEPESLVDILAPPPPGLPAPDQPDAPPAGPVAAPRAAEGPGPGHPHKTCPGAGRTGQGRRPRRTAPRCARARNRPGPALADPVPGPGETDDDLLLIAGVDPQAAAVLERFGLTRFAQIAALAPETAAQIEQALAAPGRIGAENWAGQARQLLDLRQDDGIE